MLQQALALADRGWSVFPIQPLSKIPACKNGLHDSSSDQDEIRKLWGTINNYNIGLRTGAASGIWVLDVDDNNALDQLQTKYGILPPTLKSKTSRGIHYIFNLPEGVVIKNSASKIADGIDVRGEGGYIVAPPSVHPDGSVYTWEGAEVLDAPKYLIDLAVKVKERKYVETPIDDSESHINNDWTTNDIQEMLICIDPDIGYEDWLSVGMALHHGGYPISLWDNWSRSGAKYVSGECLRKWRSFDSGSGITIGTLVHMAQSNGWKPDAKKSNFDIKNINGVDLSGFILNTKTKIDENKPTKPFEVGGLIQETVDWINSTSFKLQPELAMMNTITALGAVFGRRFALQKLNTRTNIYMIGVAETGQGKDASRKRIKRLMNKSGLADFLGADEVRSGAGLMVELKQKPSIICNIDEMGMFMRGLFDIKAPAYLREISSMFTKLYSSSDGEYVGGLIASKPDERTILVEPNLCIYGTTTLGSYSEAMRKSAIASGELNRFIVLRPAISYPPPNFEASVTDPPDYLVSRWEKFKPEIKINNVILPKNTVVLLGDQESAVNKLYLKQDQMIQEHAKTGLGALWVRYRENILKIAMILAICRDFDKPIITKDDLDKGSTIVEASIEFMMNFAIENMYDNDFEKSCSSFVKVIEESGEISRGELNRILRFKPKDLDAIETTMVEIGKVEIFKNGKTKNYRIA